MNKLAICVPTVNHAEVVESVLNYGIDFLQEHGVDIYYYDSSEDDSTRRVIENLNMRGYHNVYHIALPQDSSYGEKVDMIFAGEGLEKDYDYTWPIKDRKMCNENMLRFVLERCNGDTDIVVPLCLGDFFEGYYCDMYSVVDFYRLFAKQVTSLETIVYNRRTVLEQYQFGLSVQAPKYQNDFWHYFFIYHRLADMQNVVISLVNEQNAYLMTSPLGKPLWTKRIFEVWIEEWIRVNYELPEIYSPHKMQVIKDTASITELLGKRETFIELHKKGILMPDVYNRYVGMWEYVTNVAPEEIRKIASGEILE